MKPARRLLTACAATALLSLGSAVPVAPAEAAVPASALRLTSTGSAAPPGFGVKGFSYQGSSCPNGTVSEDLSPDQTTLTLGHSAFEVQTGPGTKTVDWRKNCKLTVTFSPVAGWQVGLASVSYQGFAEIPKGARGALHSTVRFGNTAHKDFNVLLPGHYAGKYDLVGSSPTKTVLWSACGIPASLNLTESANISPTHLPALLAVDHVSGKAVSAYGLTMRQC